MPSCLFIRKRHDLISALSISPSYLRNTFSDSGLVTDYRDWQIPLGRRFRALKIWFVLRTYGTNGLKAYIRKHIALGEKFAGWIREREDLFKILTPPAFALTVLTLAKPKDILHEDDPDGEATETEIKKDAAIPAIAAATSNTTQSELTNSLTKSVYETINTAGQIFLTSTVVKGIYAIRVVSVNERTEEVHLRKAYEILVTTAEAVIAAERRRMS